MNSNASTKENDLDLTLFATRFLKDRGAVLEPKNQVVDVLLPRNLCAALDVEDYISLAEDAQNIKKFSGQQCYSIQFQSPLLDRIVSMAGAKSPFLHADLKFTYIKTQGFANLIQEQFEFYKSKIKVTGTAQIKARYILLTCRYLAQSDEQKQGLLDFSIHLDTGALVPGMSRMIPNAEKEYRIKNIQGCSKEEIRLIHDLVRRYGPDAVELELVEFVQSMNRRFKRDSMSLEEYYKALENEMKESLLRTGISSKLIQERQAKIDMIPGELAAKKHDLLNKYSIKINFVPVAAMSVTTACVKVFITLISGRKKMNTSMIYNPVTKLMDPMVCKSCGMSMYSLGMDKNMHLSCTTCLDSANGAPGTIKKVGSKSMGF